MGKLHELLAVDGNHKTQSEKVRTELIATFDKKRHLFEQKRVTFQPLAEGAQPTTEEQTTIQSTVRRELNWIRKFLVDCIDVSHAVNVANLSAKADVVLEDGTTLLKDVPATTLLEAQKRIAEIHALANAIPTLDPAKGYTLDKELSSEGDVHKAREVTRTRTKKEKKVLVAAPATEKHPAQVQVYDEDVAIGTIHTHEWSGMMTTADKADMIARIEELQRAFKKARARANNLDVAPDVSKIGAVMVKYIFGF